MTEITSGDVTTYVYFDARDATDYVTPETGLSGFTIERSRNGGDSWTTWTTPTIVEVDNGIYALLVDEDTTVAGTKPEEMAIRITHASIATIIGTVTLKPDVPVAILDLADSIETGMTLRQALRGMAAILFGKVSGGGTGTETFRNAVADSADRIVSTNDEDGNRTAITANL